MKKLLLIAIMASGLVACAQSPAPKEDTKLKDAYSACINTAEGNPDKVQACQSVLNVPIRWRGRTWGSLNLLHAERWYGPDDAIAMKLSSASSVPSSST